MRDFKIPEDCQGEPRFGVNCYHHPELIETAQQSSRTGVFIELLEMFQASVFADSRTAEWIGSSTELLSCMLNDESTKHVAAKYSPEQLGRLLGKLEAQGFPGIERLPRQKLSRVWRITRAKPSPENCPF
jgi:hypothetical protein